MLCVPNMGEWINHYLSEKKRICFYEINFDFGLSLVDRGT